MIRNIQETKIEYGDFQTPLDLAEKVCQKLVKLGVDPDVILEPTCGIGNFIEVAAHKFTSVKKIIGIELHSHYLQELERKPIFKDPRVEIRQGNFFNYDWSSLINLLDGKILVLGNFPWVTNSRQGMIEGINLPQKYNFQNHQGLEALTGKSNFDISEWMLIQVVHWLQKRDASLAMLCKTSVARKILNYLQNNKLNLAYCSTYKIETKQYFNAMVDSCLLFCNFDTKSKNYFCDVFKSLDISTCHRIGYRNNILIQDLDCFDTMAQLYTAKGGQQWRSGIKHDCSDIMEFRKIGNSFINGIGEKVDLEETYLFPLIKGSDVAQNRILKNERYVIVTQKSINESTESIQNLAPKTWKYLESHKNFLDQRKSKVYKNKPRFSIFGVGAYTFAPWKIAICGLYKKLEFRLIGTVNNKPAVFDDTVYFLSFDDYQAASQTLELLNSPLARQFYSSLIFWDEKRPIKSSILNRLNLPVLANSLINLSDTE